MGSEAWGQPRSGALLPREQQQWRPGDCPHPQELGNSDPFRFLAPSLIAVTFLCCKKFDLLYFFPRIASCCSLVRTEVAGDSKGQAVLGADLSSPSLSDVLSRVRLMVGHERVSHWGCVTLLLASAGGWMACPLRSSAEQAERRGQPRAEILTEKCAGRAHGDKRSLVTEDTGPGPAVPPVL